MKKPFVGITTSFYNPKSGMNRSQISQAYIDAIQNAGGIPLLLAPSTLPEDCLEIADKIDGLLLTGGGDIAPERFNGVECPEISSVDHPRDAIEIALAKTFHELDKPILGICRGLQVINVALGGSLFTDILTQFDTTIQHQNPGPNKPATRREIVHSVELAEGTLLSMIYKLGATEVNSFHHQAIQQLGSGLIESSYAPDGILEGVEDPTKKFFVGVQWHPEWLTYQSQTRALFGEFVEACRGGVETI